MGLLPHTAEFILPAATIEAVKPGTVDSLYPLENPEAYSALVDLGTHFVTFSDLLFSPVNGPFQHLGDNIYGQNPRYAFAPEAVDPVLHVVEYRAHLAEIGIDVGHIEALQILEESLKRQTILTRDATYQTNAESNDEQGEHHE